MRRSGALSLLVGLVLSGGYAGSGDKGSALFFNGKDLEGWHGLTEYWRVEKGAIVGATPKGLSFNTFLCSKQKYADFELSFKVRLKGGTVGWIRTSLTDPV